MNYVLSDREAAKLVLSMDQKEPTTVPCSGNPPSVPLATPAIASSTDLDEHSLSPHYRSRPHEHSDSEYVDSFPTSDYIGTPVMANSYHPSPYTTQSTSNTSHEDASCYYPADLYYGYGGKFYSPEILIIFEKKKKLNLIYNISRNGDQICIFIKDEYQNGRNL